MAGPGPFPPSLSLSFPPSTTSPPALTQLLGIPCSPSLSPPPAEAAQLCAALCVLHPGETFPFSPMVIFPTLCIYLSRVAAGFVGTGQTVFLGGAKTSVQRCWEKLIINDIFTSIKNNKP